MPGRLKIHLYCLCWNDARLLPYFFRHYDGIVDKYFVFDNGSTDESISMLQNHGRVELTHFDVPGDSFVDEERRLSDTVWSGSDADWAIVIDIDEHIFHPALVEYLLQCKEQNLTAIRSIGYEMVSDSFPTADEPLVELVTIGKRSLGYDRLCLFNPSALTATNFGPGRHMAKPEGRVAWPKYPEVLLLHYKQLGTNYPIARSAELKLGLRPRDLKEGWGVHYTWSAGQIAENWRKVKDASGPVPGLGVSKHIEPANYFAEERSVHLSGLFDEEWYLATYPDVKAAGVDALSHFCAYGWKEGRKPNFYFDAKWYCRNYPETHTNGRNPLCEYMTRGEKQDAWPSPLFNTGWYRVQHGLSVDESPLRHYLLRRTSGLVSPVPDFDVLQSRRPEIFGLGNDPFENAFSEINVIGKPAEEARDEVDRFLDSAAMASVDRVRIVHGHGMDILKRAIADLLAVHLHVEKFYPASPSEGGGVATVVELK